MAGDDGVSHNLTAGRFGQVSSSDLTNPKVIQLLDYWNAKVTDGRLPSRDDVDPIDLGFILGDLILVDVERDPLRFRFRLMGVGMVERLGNRLATEGGSPQEWAQLLGALGVLGETDRAREIWTEAQGVFEGNAEALAVVRGGAERAGVAE